MGIIDINKIDNHALLELRNAVVIQAAQDYMKYYIPGSESQPLEAILLENWFKSDKFKMLGVGVSGDWFVKNLQELKGRKKRPLRKEMMENR